MNRITGLCMVVCILACCGGTKPGEETPQPIEEEKVCDETAPLQAIPEDMESEGPDTPVTVVIRERFGDVECIDPLSLPEDIRKRLHGIWSTIENSTAMDAFGDGKGKFSWGADWFNPKSYLVFDFGAEPPELMLGAYGWHVETGIEKAAGFDDTRVLLVFRNETGAEAGNNALYLTLLPDDVLDLEVLKSFDERAHQPGEKYRYYRVNGPDSAEQKPEKIPAPEAGAALFKDAPRGDVGPEDLICIDTETGNTLALGGSMEETVITFGGDLSAVEGGYFLKGLTVLDEGGTISRIIISGQSPFRTRRGIGIGSTSSDIAACYGGNEGMEEYAYYVRRDEGIKRDILAFYLSGERVERIVIHEAAP